MKILNDEDLNQVNGGVDEVRSVMYLLKDSNGNVILVARSRDEASMMASTLGLSNYTIVEQTV